MAEVTVWRAPLAVGDVLPRLRDLILEAAERDVREAERGNPEVPWMVPGLADEQRGDLRRMEVLGQAVRECDLLAGAGEALSVEFQAERVELIERLGPLAGWDGTSAGLDLILDETTPEHVDSGDARGKRAFVRATVPALRAAGVSDEEIMEVAARTTMRPRLSWAVSRVQRDPAFVDKEEAIRQAVLDARTLPVREFERSWRDYEVDPAPYDEVEAAPGSWRRTYALDEGQRRAFDSALRNKQVRSATPVERVTWGLVDRARAGEDWGLLYRALLSPDALAALRAVEGGAGSAGDLAGALGCKASKAARLLTTLEAAGMVALDGVGAVRLAGGGGSVGDDGQGTAARLGSEAEGYQCTG